MKIIPLDDRVLVKPFEAQEVTKGGIVLPDSAKEKPQQGEVVAVGIGKLLKDGKRQALTVKVGDKVVFSKYAGNEIKVEGDKYIIMRENEILGILS